MRYALLFHYPEANEATLGAEAMQEGQEAFAAYAQALHQAGVLLSGEVLQSSDSTTTMQLRDGEVQIQDGPFIETKEQLGGLMVIEVETLDDAITWASQSPAAQWGSVEIRPGATYVVEGKWTM